MKLNNDLKKILDLHKLYLEANNRGVKADLRGADLRDADLFGADLRGADLRGANLRGANLRCANLRGTDFRDADLLWADLFSASLQGADLRGANLHRANLVRADLQGADLQGADLDYSCLPLWCGSLSAHFDDRQLKQIAYHLVKAGLRSKNASAETKAELRKIIDFANGFHRAQECGYIVAEEEEKDKSNNFHKGEKQ